MTKAGEIAFSSVRRHVLWFSSYDDPTVMLCVETDLKQ